MGIHKPKQESHHCGIRCNEAQWGEGGEVGGRREGKEAQQCLSVATTEEVIFPSVIELGAHHV